STSLSILGADDGGELNLAYSWSVVGTSPAPVTFSASGNNPAKNTIANFTKAGVYTLEASISDSLNLITSDICLTVSQTLTALTVTAPLSGVHENASQTLSALAIDQFGNA